MEFDFLPNLPKSDLDDRKYQDLVEECILRIPRYCPEWTNHNAADPGITLIEMFAWLTDQMLLRFNQVPRRNYVAFLELLGIRLQPPKPARTNVTFYLTRAQRADTRISPIPAGTEVATERSETQDAIVFRTDRPLPIGVPHIRYFLTAEGEDFGDVQPQVLRDRLSNTWNQDNDGRWSGRSQFVFQERPQPGNCFYLGLEPDDDLQGNVLVLTIEGEPAGSTGIDPNYPPRRWEAWDGRDWQPILWDEAHDQTRGFSFDGAGQQDHRMVRKADVRLHLPLVWPATYFTDYYGCWLRCVYQPSEDATRQSSSIQSLRDPAPRSPNPDTGRNVGGREYGYSRAPKFSGLSVRAIGGTVPSSQCQFIQNELLGESSGKPGQTFQLQSGLILERDAETEYILVQRGDELPQVWQEVNDFADSGPGDRHYTLDSVTGQIQFGPLIREPSKLRTEVEMRQHIQRNGAHPHPNDIENVESLERQYGAVPPRGALIRMSAYRTSEGFQGNVPKDALRIVKSAIPYVAKIYNHEKAEGGTDAETLEEAVIRVPKWLRTRNRAVTPEDFETLAKQATPNVHRAHCSGHTSSDGMVEVFLVPWIKTAESLRRRGIAPDQLSLSDTLKQDVLDYLKPRQLLGIGVTLKQPDYVGVSVQVEVGIDPQYDNPQAQQTIRNDLLNRLYRFLNPLEGGHEGNGWPLGVPVYRSDIVSLVQKTLGVRYLGTVQLFAIRRNGNGWTRTLATDGTVDPGAWGLITSWQNTEARTSHVVTLL